MEEKTMKDKNRFGIIAKDETKCYGHGDYREETYFYIYDTTKESMMFPGEVVCRFGGKYGALAVQVLEYLNKEF